MIFNMTGTGGGGAGLNLWVVGGLVQPENPQENTIWVPTETDITAWAISADEPANLIEGMVWLKTGITATKPLNVLTDNALLIYPTYCYQYISGELVSKPAMTYSGGAWFNWITYLYNHGDPCENVTGGWVGATNTGDDFIQVSKFNGTSDMKPADPFDLSGFSSLSIVYKYWGHPGAYDASYSNTKPSEVRFELRDEAGNVVGTFANHSISSQTKEADATEKTASMDISAINKPCRLFAVVVGAATHQSYGGSATISLYEARVE